MGAPRIAPTAPRVAIIGAGVAGLALNRALRLLGIPSTVYERRVQLRCGLDRGLGLWGESQQCLRAMGVDVKSHFGGHHSADLGHLIPPAAYRNSSGTWLSQCSPTPANLSRVVALCQNELYEALGAPERPGVYVGHRYMGHQLVELHVNQDGWELRFDNGATASADLVVGADGSSSVTRLLIESLGDRFDSWCQPTTARSSQGQDSTQYTYFSAVVPVDTGCLPFETLGPRIAAANHSSALVRALGGAGVRFASVPLGNGRSFWFASVPSCLVPGAVEPQDGQVLEYLTELLREWHSPIPELLRQVIAIPTTHCSYSPPCWL